MKKLNFWHFLMPVMMLFAAFTLSACGDDVEPEPTPTPIPVPDPYEVNGTSWEELHSFSDGSSITIRITFTSTSSANYQLEEKDKNGRVTTTSSNYTYQRSKNLVVMTPLVSGNATLECKIDESGIKMEVTNTSNDSKIATMYKR